MPFPNEKDSKEDEDDVNHYNINEHRKLLGP